MSNDVADDDQSVSNSIGNNVSLASKSSLQALMPIHDEEGALNLG